MKKLHSQIVLSLAIGLIVPTLAAAQLAVPAQGSTTTSGAKTAVACEKITEKVEARIAKFNSTGESHTMRVDKTIALLKATSEKLKVRGLDTAVLDSQIATLLEKKNKLEASKQAFIAKLSESKGFTCGISQGQFKTKIAEARKLQQVVVADAKDVHEFVKTIRDSIKTVRAQVASSTPAVPAQ